MKCKGYRRLAFLLQTPEAVSSTLREPPLGHSTRQEQVDGGSRADGQIPSEVGRVCQQVARVDSRVIFAAQRA